MTIKSETESFSQLMEHHNRNKFSCGIDSLDNYLKNQSKQDLKRRLSVTYVLNDDDQNIIGYYTLSSTSFLLEHLPEENRRKLPRYPSLPATLIGRLAVDKKYQGRGYGEILLMDALLNAQQVSKKTGVFAVVVEAINQVALKFYQKFGFIQLQDHDNKLFLPMKTIDQLILE